MMHFNGPHFNNDVQRSHPRRARSSPSPHEAFPTIIPPSQVPLPSKFSIARPRRTLEFQLPSHGRPSISKRGDSDFHTRGRQFAPSGFQYRPHQSPPQPEAHLSCVTSWNDDSESEVVMFPKPVSPPEASQQRLEDARSRHWRSLWDLEDDERNMESQLLTQPPLQKAWSILLSPPTAEPYVVKDHPTCTCDDSSSELPGLVVVSSSFQSTWHHPFSHVSEWMIDNLPFPHLARVANARSRSLSPSNYSASFDSLAASSSSTSSPSSSSVSSSSVSLSSPSSVFTEPPETPTGSTTLYRISPEPRDKPHSYSIHSLETEDDIDDVLHVQLRRRPSSSRDSPSEPPFRIEPSSHVCFGSDPLTSGTQLDNLSTSLLLPEAIKLPLNNPDLNYNSTSFSCRATSHRLSLSSSPLSVLGNIFGSIMGVSRVLVDSYAAGSSSPTSSLSFSPPSQPSISKLSLELGSQITFTTMDIKPYGYRVGPKEVGMVFGQSEAGEGVTGPSDWVAPIDEGDCEMCFSSILERVISFGTSSYEFHSSNLEADVGAVTQVARKGNIDELVNSRLTSRARRFSSEGEGSYRKHSPSKSPPPTMVNLQRYPIIPYNPPPIRQESFPKVRDIYNGIWWCNLVPGGRDGRIDGDVLVSTELPIPSICRKTSRPPPHTARRRNLSSGRMAYKRSKSRSASPTSRGSLERLGERSPPRHQRRSPSPSPTMANRPSMRRPSPEEPITRGRARTPRSCAMSSPSLSLLTTNTMNPDGSVPKPSIFSHTLSTVPKRSVRSTSFSRVATLDVEPPSIFLLWAVKASMRYKGMNEELIDSIGAKLRGVRGIGGNDLDSLASSRRKRNTLGGGKSPKVAREGRECDWQNGVGIAVRSSLRFEITEDGS